MDYYSISRLFHTIRHLKAIQIFYRFYYKFHRPKVEVPSGLAVRHWPNRGVFRAWATRKMKEPGCFEFLGIQGAPINRYSWNDSQKPKLWLYNLHYFDDLNAIDSNHYYSEHKHLIQRWIAENPPPHGNGWEAYPLSLRIVNWVKWFTSGHDVESYWISSLATQAHVLHQRLEYHLLGNHLFTNGKALIFAGAFFNGPQAEDWLRLGLKTLHREIHEQFLPDGGHFELSPMYQAILLWDLCDLLSLAHRTQLAEIKSQCDLWRQTIQKGLHWLKTMSHPDGEISFFNDATFGVAPDFQKVQSYAQTIIPEAFVNQGETTSAMSHTLLEESGYCRVDLPQAGVALLDVGRIGPDYLPAHAHADTLSFELSLFTQRVFVNSGISTYDNTPERLYQRGSSAHNTVVVNEMNSSEIWSSFRVARRAYPSQASIQAQHNRLSIEASHDGYRYLPGKNTHRRRWVFSENTLNIFDVVEGSFHEAAAYFHLHPNVQIVKLYNNGMAAMLRLQYGQEIMLSVEKGVLQIIPTYWHTSLGSAQPTFCVKVTFSSPRLKTTIQWS